MVAVKQDPSEFSIKSISEYADAMRRVPGGQLLSGAGEDLATKLVYLYGAPVIGLATLAPEILANEKLTLLLGGEIGNGGASAGGRWLTLYARVVNPGCKLSYVICTPERQKPQKTPRAVLMQPPQRLVHQDWDDYITDVGSLDAIVLGFRTFDEIWDGLSSPRLRAAAGELPILLYFPSQADTIIARAIARKMRYAVSDPAMMPEAEGIPSHRLLPGAWWIRIDAHSGEDLKPDTEEKESIRGCFNGFRSFVEAADGDSEAEGVAATYGVFATLDVEGEEVQTIQITPDSGIDCASGKLFRATDDALVWTRDRIPERMMRMLPDARGGSALAVRYQAMLWMSRALAVELEGVEAQDGRQPATGETISADGGQAVVDPRDATEGAQDDPADERTTEEEQSERRRQRTLLAREPGITNVLAIAARLGRPESADARDFGKAKVEILRWLDEKGFSLDPSKASQIVETPKGEVTAEGDEQAFWAIRFDDRAQMASGAFWRVEATLLANDGAPAIGIRVSQIRQLASAPPPVPGVPRVVKSVAAAIGLHDSGYPLKPTPWRVQGAVEAGHLLALLTDVNRVQPVIVVSIARNQDADVLLERLASRLTGVAHIVAIDAAAADALIGRLGRNLSVFGKAIRLYRPGFSEESDPFRQILWTYPGDRIPERVANEISEDACAIGIQAENVEERVPSFQYVRNAMSDRRLRRARQRTQEAASSAQEERERQQAVRDELERQLENYKELVKTLDAKYRRAKEGASKAEAERDSADHLVRQLKYQLNAKQTGSVSVLADEGLKADQVDYPDTWDDLEAWVELYGNDRIVLLPQALKAARSSPFRDIQFAYRVLEFMAVHYVEMKMRAPDDEGPRVRYEAAKAELGIEVGPVGDAVDDKRYKKEYRKLHKGRTIKLDQHVKRGVGFDGTTLFRLYFSYDSDSNKVVVGHLPTHLTNRISHQG